MVVWPMGAANGGWSWRSPRSSGSMFQSTVGSAGKKNLKASCSGSGELVISKRSPVIVRLSASNARRIASRNSSPARCSITSLFRRRRPKWGSAQGTPAEMGSSERKIQVKLCPDCGGFAEVIMEVQNPRTPLRPSLSSCTMYGSTSYWIFRCSCVCGVVFNTPVEVPRDDG